MTGSEIVIVSQLTSIVLGACLATIALIVIVALIRVPESAIRLLLIAIQSGLIIRMTTAIVIVIAVFGLRLANMISAEATIATLSGIAGYILGGQVARPSSAEPQEIPSLADTTLKPR